MTLCSQPLVSNLFFQHHNASFANYCSIQSEIEDKAGYGSGCDLSFSVKSNQDRGAHCPQSHLNMITPGNTSRLQIGPNSVMFFFYVILTEKPMGDTEHVILPDRETLYEYKQSII